MSEETKKLMEEDFYKIVGVCNSDCDCQGKYPHCEIDDIKNWILKLLRENFISKAEIERLCEKMEYSEYLENGDRNGKANWCGSDGEEGYEAAKQEILEKIKEL